MKKKQNRVDKKRRLAKQAITKKRDHLQSSKGSFHCGCGQRITSLKDWQSVTCGTCGATHYGPK